MKLTPIHESGMRSPFLVFYANIYIFMFIEYPNLSSTIRFISVDHNGRMFRYAQVLQMIDQSRDMHKSCERLIGVLICQSLEND